MKDFGCVLLSICLIGCTGKPKPYEVYQSLLSPKIRVQIAAVGKNWEIKDAVANGRLSDRPVFHGQVFWKHKNDETLVVIDYDRLPAYFSFPLVYSLEQFQREYKRIKE